MTCIVNPALFKSKVALQAACEAGKVWIEDPSFFAPRHFNASSMVVGQSEVVTNHPIRNKFAKITRTESGFKVS